MGDECRVTNDEWRLSGKTFRHSDFVIPSSFVIRHSSLFSDLAHGRNGSYSSAGGRPSDRPVEIVERSVFCLACPGRRPESSNVAQSPAPEIVKSPVPESAHLSA